jgi:fermentation-respiration switch protein FrsA (DUF1100 family)
MKTGLVVTALVAIALYCLVVGLLAWQQRRFLYVPDPRRPDLQATGVADAQVVSVHTVDGLDLLAWWVAPSGAAMPVVLYLHGNAGNIEDRARRFAQVSRSGWGMLLLEYRGYGGNPGAPTEAGLLQDARAAYAWLHSGGITAARVLPWGESLGTGVAVRLAGEVDVGAVLLESPYTSIAAVAQRRFPFAPVDWLILDRFDLIGRIGAVHAPVLVMTGGRDTIVPPAMGRAAFALANEPKRFWFAPDAGHNGLIEAGLFDAVQGFVRDCWKPQP